MFLQGVIQELDKEMKRAFADEKLPRVVLISDAADRFARSIATLLYAHPPDKTATTTGSSSSSSTSGGGIHAFLTKNFDDMRTVFSTLLNRVQTL